MVGNFSLGSRWLAVSLGLGFGLGLLFSDWPRSRLLGVQPSLAQARRIKISEAWRDVYKELPDLPLENRYIKLQTGQVDPDDTLVDRMIRYHIYVKGRPPNLRLDWKLTLADYLGVNELITRSTYPGARTLTQHPLDGDREAVRRLSRTQREALVQALLRAFTP